MSIAKVSISQTKLCGVNCSSFLPFKDRDLGTGRCRLKPSLFNKLGIRTGWILHITLRLEFPVINEASTSTDQEVVCTAYPDVSNFLPDDTTVCIDDTVLATGPAIWRDWMLCECQV
jgi:hypothetical protein